MVNHIPAPATAGKIVVQTAEEERRLWVGLVGVAHSHQSQQDIKGEVHQESRTSSWRNMTPIWDSGKEPRSSRRAAATRTLCG